MMGPIISKTFIARCLFLYNSSLDGFAAARLKGAAIHNQLYHRALEKYRKTGLPGSCLSFNFYILLFNIFYAIISQKEFGL